MIGRDQQRAFHIQGFGVFQPQVPHINPESQPRRYFQQMVQQAFVGVWLIQLGVDGEMGHDFIIAAQVFDA